MSRCGRVTIIEAIVLLIVTAGQFRASDAQFPRVCTSADHISQKECCPIPPGFTEPCGGPGRGRCTEIADATVDDPAWKEAYKVDDRRHWPTVFFNRACVCEGYFSGYDCTKCIWGRRGRNCTTEKLSVRRNIRHLSPEDVETVKRYFNAAKTAPSDYAMALEFYEDINGSEDFADVSVYNYFVATHYYASRATMPPYKHGYCKTEADCQIDFAHEGSGFPTWHRAFLLELERALQEVNNDPDFTIPYWDWTEAENCTICTNDYVGANYGDGSLDPRSLFATWETICVQSDPFYNATSRNHTKPCDVTKRDGHVMRNPGHQDRKRFGESMYRLPTAAEVDFGLRFPTFDRRPYSKTANCTFRNLLEGFADTSTGKYRGDRYVNGTLIPGAHTLHNHVHLYLDGTMSAVPSSVNDPVFSLHHCFVDRIFEKWIRRHKTPSNEALPKTGASPGHNRHEYIVPFFPPYSHADLFKPSTALGYDYEDVDGDGMSEGERIQDSSNLGECSTATDPWTDVLIYVVIGVVGFVILVATFACFCCIFCYICKRRQQRSGAGRSNWVPLNTSAPEHA
ncbi:tyrosinase-like [Branchiostoma floridae x Branchiostoma japonicum]